jgi:hypothetical protein
MDFYVERLKEHLNILFEKAKLFDKNTSRLEHARSLIKRVESECNEADLLDVGIKLHLVRKGLDETMELYQEKFSTNSADIERTLNSIELFSEYEPKRKEGEEIEDDI